MTQLLFSEHTDPQALFAPENPDNLVAYLDPMGVHISCRVSHPYSDVILRSVPGGEEVPAFFDNRMGFFGTLAPGQYQCETTVNGRMGKSAVYTVEAEGESGQTSPLWLHS